MRAFLAFGVGFLMLVCGPLGAAETGHYVNGVEGIKGGSVPPPGVYWRSFNLYYHADTNTDRDGDDLEIGFDLEVAATVQRLIWITPWKVLGADFGMDVIVPVVNQDLEVKIQNLEDEEGGVGDLWVEPLVLAWHKPRWDLAFGVGAYMPTGAWDDDEPASIGKDCWTGMFTLGGTLYLDAARTWSASILARYEIHDEKRHTEVRIGNDFHFEWGVGKAFKSGWEVGLTGYCQWQVTDDQGSDVTWDADVHDRVFGIGPEISYFCQKARLGISLRHEQEFGAVDRPEGHVTTLTLTKIF